MKLDLEIMTVDRATMNEMNDLFLGSDIEVSTGKVSEFGGGAEWILVLSAATTSLAALVRAAYPYFDRGRVKAIRIGDTYMVYPRQEQVESLLRDITTEAEKNRGTEDAQP